jgi:hypothetical protein
MEIIKIKNYSQMRDVIKDLLANTTKLQKKKKKKSLVSFMALKNNAIQLVLFE